MSAPLEIVRPTAPSGPGDGMFNVDNVAVIGIEPADSQDPGAPREVAIARPNGFTRSWFVLWHTSVMEREFGTETSLLARYVNERAIAPELVVQNLEAAAQGYVLFASDPVSTAWRLKHLYERAEKPGQVPAIGDLGRLMSELDGRTGRSVAEALNLHSPFDRVATETHQLSKALQSLVGIRRVSKR